MSVSGVGSSTSLLVQSLVNMRSQLDDLQTQLGTGLKSQTYAGLGTGSGLSVALNAQLSALSSYDDSIRNARVYRATLASGRRIDERWNLWAEYSYERSSADAQPELVPGLSGDAYSQNSHNLGLNLEYSLNERTFLSLGILGRHGDVVSTTAPSAGIFYASRALAEDPAFGPEDYAYKLTGTTYGVRLGIDYSLTAHSLLGCGFERLVTHANGGNSYTKSIPQITWDYRF